MDGMIYHTPYGAAVGFASHVFEYRLRPRNTIAQVPMATAFDQDFGDQYTFAVWEFIEATFLDNDGIPRTDSIDERSFSRNQLINLKLQLTLLNIGSVGVVNLFFWDGGVS
jgi:hypothetical protein